jgi:hypothetical protein
MRTMEAVLGSGLDMSSGVVKTVGTAALGLTTAFKGITTVRTGEMGVRTRFGKVQCDRHGSPKIVGPGIRFTFPGTHSINKVDVRYRSTDLAPLMIDRDDQYCVNSSVRWRVSPHGDNPFKALYETDNLHETVMNICLDGLRATMTDRSVPETELGNAELLFAGIPENFEPAAREEEDIPEPFKGVRDRCEEPLLEIGVELDSLRILSCARSIGQMLGRGGPTTGAAGIIAANTPTGSDTGMAVPGHLTVIQ